MQNVNTNMELSKSYNFKPFWDLFKLGIELLAESTLMFNFESTGALYIGRDMMLM